MSFERSSSTALTIQTLKQGVNFEHISHLVLVFLLLTPAFCGVKTFFCFVELESTKFLLVNDM